MKHFSVSKLIIIIFFSVFLLLLIKKRSTQDILLPPIIPQSAEDVIQSQETDNIELTPEPTLLLKSDGTTMGIKPDSTELLIDDGSLIAQLIQYRDSLQMLQKIQLADGLPFTIDDIRSLQSAFPESSVEYSIKIGEKYFDIESEIIDLSFLRPEMVEEAVRELEKFSNLKRVELCTSGSSALQLSDVGLLEDARPEAVFDYTFSLFGRNVSTSDERWEYENEPIGDIGVENELRPVLPYMNHLSYLKLDKCDVSSPVMAKLRDDFPNVKIVWRVYFSSNGEGPYGKVTYNCLTDTEKIWATGCVTDHFAAELKYCTDVRYLDLGHNCITNIDFVSYMPKLEVAVLSITWIADISPLANCPNLEYLEVFSSKVTDISPLAKCMNLKHLNISNLSAVKDIQCLYGLENLERFFCSMSHIPQDQQDKFRELHPGCECEFGWVDPSKSTWRFIDGNSNHDTEDNYVDRYALLRKQIGYGNKENLSC